MRDAQDFFLVGKPIILYSELVYYVLGHFQVIDLIPHAALFTLIIPVLKGNDAMLKRLMFN